MPGQLRAPIIVLEPLAEGSQSLLAPLVVTEPLAEGASTIRASLLATESLAEGNRNLRVALVFVEALVPVPPEGTVSTELYPGSMGSPTALPGLTYTIHKRPGFSTAKYKGASGVGVRRSNMQYPIWEIELSYSVLRDIDSINNNEFKTLCGFFMSRHGDFDTFLLKDKDDYNVVNGLIGTGDGVTSQFSFKRTFGGFAEKVGQVDTGNTITLYGTVAENGTIPNVPGPYTITTAHAAAFVQDLGVTKAGVAMTKVAGSPAAGQYSVAAGVYTFNSADHSAAVVITYRYTIAPAAYTVTLPNLVVFSVAPANGLIISADFQFFFNCVFQDPAADFEKFCDKFWELQKIVLETVPQ